MDEKVRRMIEKPGVYIAGDSKAPNATVVLVSIRGKVYSIVLDQKGFLTRLH